MANTTNFGWETPDDTDLVKDGALAMRTLGNAIDTSLVDLKGGTTGQILAKNTNTDMDFVWINNDQGDITAVNAGTGLTGGGTSGAVTVSLDSPVAATLGGTAQTTYATGDLLYASGTNTLAKRAIGTTGQVLTVSGGVPTWASPAGGGKVLQVVQASTSTATTIASTSMTDSGLSASITPSATSSKILVLITQRVRARRSIAGRIVGSAQILRGATVVSAESEVIELMCGSVTLDGTPQIGTQSTYANAYLDSPSTTSSITYKTQFAASTTSDSGQIVCQSNSGVSYITLIEIGA